MISPHVLFLVLILVLALMALLCYRLRPRLFMKTMRWMDKRSGGAIIVLGLSVLICGCLGFANVQKPSSSTTANAELPTNNQVLPSADKDGQAEAIEDRKATEPGMARPPETNKGEASTSLAGALYETFQIFAFNVDREVLEHSFLLRIAMMSAVLLATIVASKGIAILFHSSYEALGLRFKSMHVVVCGLGKIGRQVLTDLEAMRSEFQIVVIEPDPENKNIAWAREMGAVVLIGDATQGDVLELAHVERAREVFVVTGSDACNIESAIEIRDILLRKGRRGVNGRQLPKLRCHVHILNQDLAGIVREKSVLLERFTTKTTRSLPGHRESELIDIEVFNALERTARRLLEDIAIKVCAGGKDSNPANSHSASLAPQVLHYFLFGFGDFGQTLALRLAELSHFQSGTRSRMSILDTGIEQRAAAFVARHSRFCAVVEPSKIWDFDPGADEWHSKSYRAGASSRLPEGSPGIEYVCNARFVEYRDIVDNEMLERMVACCETTSVQPVILVCFEEDRENFARAERLRARLEALGKDWPIFVWIPRQRELSQLLLEQKNLHSKDTQPTSPLTPFGQCYGSVSYSELNDSWMDWLARHLHLVWMGKEDPNWSKSIGRFQAALERLSVVEPPNSEGTEQPAAQATDSPSHTRLISSRKSIEEFSRLDWEELNEISKRVWDGREEWERASNRSCAAHAVLKASALGLRIVGYATKPSGTPPEFLITPDLEERLRMMEHYRWVAERLLTGWQYDEERSSVRKTRWQITPWSSLDNPPSKAIAVAKERGKSLNEKLKDELIVRMIVGLIRVGLLQAESLPH